MLRRIFFRHQRYGLVRLLSTADAPLDPWSILGVNRNAGKEKISRAYKKKALETHPDLTGKDSKLFLEVKKAFDMLMKEDASKKKKKRQWTSAKKYQKRYAKNTSEEKPKEEMQEEVVDVMDLFTEQLRDQVQDGDIDDAWDTWNQIKVFSSQSKKPLAEIHIKSSLASIFKLNFSSSKDIKHSIDIIDDAVSTNLMEQGEKPLAIAFNVLLWVCKDFKDIDGAMIVMDEISKHGLPSNVGQQMLQEMYREVYQTRGV